VNRRGSLLALAAALFVVAVVVPVAWFLTRPSESEGVTVGSFSASSSPAPTGSSSAAPAPSSSVPSIEVRPATPTAGSDTVDRPQRVRIPALGVDAPVDAVGVRDDGAMLIPEDVRRIGWYRFGSAPADGEGATVLAGHVDSKAQGLGALGRLRELGVGDQIDVTLGSGDVARYRVVGKETLVKKRLPTEKLFARDGAPRLVIVTCGGPFIPELSSYRDNLVVIAEPVT
jgi:sortase (surface protein transpeptidase)